MRDDRVPMDVTVSWGVEPMARLMRAVVRFDCQITDTYMLPGRKEPRANPVYLRIQVPRASIDAFRAESKPREMREPPKLDLGWSTEEQPAPGDEGGE